MVQLLLLGIKRPILAQSTSRFIVDASQKCEAVPRRARI